MKIMLLIEYETAYLVKEALEAKIEVLEYKLDKSNDPLRHKFYDRPEILAEQLQNLHDIVRQLS